ncbi:MAG: hypothetical protein VCA36_00475 [Opitutales bacterium]
MDISKFRGFDPKAKWLLIAVAAIIAYAIGSVLAEFIALILGAAACAGAYWAFFGFGKK